MKVKIDFEGEIIVIRFDCQAVLLLEVDLNSTCMYKEYNPGFARHKGGAASPRAEILWEEQQIGIHWKDLPSANPDDYSGRGSQEISNLNGFAEEGAIVGASYRDVTKTEMLVGVVEPESEIELLYFDGADIVKREFVEPGQATPSEAGDAMILKTLPLSNVQTVSIEEHPIIFESGVRPRHWSVCNWWNGEEHLRAIINQTSKPFSVHSLKPDQLEVVCEEFLRIVDGNYTRLAGIGGTSADIDISGISGDTRIWGQVTMGGTGTVRSKLETLEDYTGNARVLMFAKQSSKPDKIPEGVTYLPVETVFSTVALSESGRSMLEEMLNLSTPE
ncbi:hypothetical protein NDI85_08870 [Halomicroarcula sp. S1AR25-4]|uniref:hypothetical protein n=1 Tax=Haloarcula sp. S1AR25-4 TaxID=2950538 RepID=UPI0028762F26|nr:hypothetical protein [Halomicroarcula sp. S1AR25-4]MDS0277907.1 hypothetical protein [Halomicroarcula sp. S1AR25-4]